MRTKTSKYLINDEANEQVVIAFENSSNELEYSVFKLLDGGVTPISSSWQDPNTSRNDDIFEALKQLRQESGFDLSAEIQEIEE